jgi:acyl carrier protein
MPPTVEEIRAQVKEIIAAVADLQPDELADDAALVEDLGLDSLSLLEVAVDVDYHFKLGLPEDELKLLRTLDDTVRLVHERVTGEAANAG